MGTALYSAARTTLAAAAGSPIAELVNLIGLATSNNSAGVVGIGITLDAATASSIGLIRSATVGVPKAANYTAGVPEAGAGSNVGWVLATDWDTPPTIAGTPSYLRKVVLPAVAGAGVSWSWDLTNVLSVFGNTSLLLWNFGSGAASICEVYFQWAEGGVISPVRQSFPIP